MRKKNFRFGVYFIIIKNLFVLIEKLEGVRNHMTLFIKLNQALITQYHHLTIKNHQPFDRIWELHKVTILGLHHTNIVLPCFLNSHDQASCKKDNIYKFKFFPENMHRHIFLVQRIYPNIHFTFIWSLTHHCHTCLPHRGSSQSNRWIL